MTMNVKELENNEVEEDTEEADGDLVKTIE